MNRSDGMRSVRLSLEAVKDKIAADGYVVEPKDIGQILFALLGAVALLIHEQERELEMKERVREFVNRK